MSTPRRGMILPMVLLFSGMLLVTGLAVWRTNQTDVQQITVNVRRVQAQFLAKGALQLALLKARLLPTPLYDAAAYSVGKNPYYVHSSGYDHLKSGVMSPQAALVPGPAFLTGLGTDDAKVLGDGSLQRTNIKKVPGTSDGESQSDNLNSEDGLAGADFVVDRYLNFFALDLADSTVASPTMSQDPRISVKGQDKIRISTSASDPYEGSFRILSINVQGARANQQYGVETLRVVAVASISSKIAGETKSWTEREETIYKVRRPY